MKSDSSKFSYFKIQELKLSQNMEGYRFVFWFLSKQYHTLRSILSLNKPLNVEMFFVKI
jgi:hypothetical protein